MKTRNKYPYVLILYKGGKEIERYHYADLTSIKEDTFGLKKELSFRVLDMNTNADITKLVKMA